MIRRDMWSGIFLFFIGLFLTLESCRLSVWSPNGPDEGFFPFFIGFLIMGLSLWIVIRSALIKQTRDGNRTSERVQAIGTSSLFKVSSYGILLLLYGTLLERVGFLITTCFFLVIILKFVERQSWKITFLAGPISTAISYLIFVYCLGVALPRGIMKGW